MKGIICLPVNEHVVDAHSTIIRVKKSEPIRARRVDLILHVDLAYENMTQMWLQFANENGDKNWNVQEVWQRQSARPGLLLRPKSCRAANFSGAGKQPVLFCGRGMREFFALCNGLVRGEVGDLQAKGCVSLQDQQTLLSSNPCLKLPKLITSIFISLSELVLKKFVTC